mgnify:CR=1 FL=1
MELIPLGDDNIDAAHRICHCCLPYDRVPPDIFRYKTLEDPDFDPELALVAVEDGLPCGFMMGVCRSTESGVSAGIKLFGVGERHRNRGIAGEMLARIERAALERGAKTLNVGFTRPNYLTPGLDPRYTVAAAFLLRRGFVRKGEAFNMDVDLNSSDWATADIEARLAGQGIVCRRLGPEERDRLRDWMAANGYSEGWRYQVMRAAEQDPVAVFVAEKDGELAAFACYDGVRPGWFGPMGTLESLRGSGIGTVAFLKCLQSMRAVGYQICEICAVGPLYFYSKTANARVSRIFWGFEKSLAE